MKVCQKKNPLDTKTGHAVHSTLLPFFVALSEQVVPHSFFCSTNFAVICCFNKHICFYQSSTLLRFYHPHTTSRIKRRLQKFPIRTRKEVERTGLMLEHQSLIQGQI